MKRTAKRAHKKKSTKHTRKKAEEPILALSEKEVKREVKKVITFTKKQLIGLVVGVVILLFIFILLFTRTSIPEDAIVRVNNEIITQAEVDKLFEQMAQQNPTITKEIVLNQTIIKYLIVSEAKAQDIVVPDSEVEAYITNLEATFQQELEPALEEMGVTMDQLKAQVREQLMMTKLLLNTVGVDDAEITEEDLQTFYDENQAALSTGDKVEASHILVETLEEANGILGELNAGADFAKLATEKSIDPSAATNNGNLGSFGRGQMVPEFEEAAFDLQEGELSDPVKSQFGYHIILLHKKETAHALAYEEVKEDIRKVLTEQLQQERLGTYLEELQAKSTIEYF